MLWPYERDHVGVVDVGVGPGLAVAAERLLERLGGGRGAQPGVAVDVVGADARRGRSRASV